MTRPTFPGGSSLSGSFPPPAALWWLLALPLTAAWLVWPYVWGGPDAALNIIDATDSLIPRLILQAQEWRQHGPLFWQAGQLAGYDRLAVDQTLWTFSSLPYLFLAPLTAVKVHFVLQGLLGVGCLFALLRRGHGVPPGPALLLAMGYAYFVIHTYWDPFYNLHHATLPAFLLLLGGFRGLSPSGLGMALVGGLAFGFFNSGSASLPFAILLVVLYFLFLEPRLQVGTWVLIGVFLLAAVVWQVPVIASVIQEAPLSHRAAFPRYFGLQGHNLFHLLASGQAGEIPGELVLALKRMYWGLVTQVPQWFISQSRIPLLFAPAVVAALCAWLPLQRALNQRRWTPLAALLFPLSFVVISQMGHLLFFLLPRGENLVSFRPERLLEYWQIALALFAALHLGRAFVPGEFPSSPAPRWARNALLLLLAGAVAVHGTGKATRIWEAVATQGTQREAIAHPGMIALAEKLSRRHDEPFRVASYAFDFHPGFVNAYGFEAADGAAPLYPGRYHRFWQTLLAPIAATEQAVHGEDFKNKQWKAHRPYLYPAIKECQRLPHRLGASVNLNLLALTNTRYIFSRLPLADERLTLDESFPMLVGGRAEEAMARLRQRGCPELGEMRVYALAGTLPRAQGLFALEVAPDDETLLQRLGVADLDTLGRVARVRRGEFPAGLDLPGQGEARVVWTARSPDRLGLEVTFSAPGVLRITNTFSPRWRGRMDGGEVALFPVDHAFTGVFIPAGRHQVELIYEPTLHLW